MINLLLKAFNIIFKTREGGRAGKKKGKKEEIEGRREGRSNLSYLHGVCLKAMSASYI